MAIPQNLHFSLKPLGALKIPIFTLAVVMVVNPIMTISTGRSYQAQFQAIFGTYNFPNWAKITTINARKSYFMFVHQHFESKFNYVTNGILMDYMLHMNHLYHYARKQRDTSLIQRCLLNTPCLCRHLLKVHCGRNSSTGTTSFIFEMDQ